jgi:predicted GIY-YIG superfamily endonuclease
MTNPRNGTIYLVHFERPYKHARHYLGWTIDLDNRLTQHANGQGARLLEVIQQAGIQWTLARTWRGTRVRERQLKCQGGAARLCPLCGVRPRQRDWTAHELNTIACRYFTLIDAAPLLNSRSLAYARKQITSRLNTPTTDVVTVANLLGWTERKPYMPQITYTPTYIRKDGSVWCVQEDSETGTEHSCRMVVDLESGLTLFVPEYLVNVTADTPTSCNTGQPWPLFRWATHNDLIHNEVTSHD